MNINIIIPGIVIVIALLFYLNYWVTEHKKVEKEKSNSTCLNPNGYNIPHTWSQWEDNEVPHGSTKSGITCPGQTRKCSVCKLKQIRMLTI